jgi:hypothetical protein
MNKAATPRSRIDFPCGLRETGHLAVPMPDAMRLSGRFWLPGVAGRVPLIRESLPCRKRHAGAIERPDGVFGHVFDHESHGRLPCGARDFIVEMHPRATENDATAFARVQHERIPRDHM